MQRSRQIELMISDSVSSGANQTHMNIKMKLLNNRSKVGHMGDFESVEHVTCNLCCFFHHFVAH